MLKKSIKVMAFAGTMFVSLFILSGETNAFEQPSCSDNSKCMYQVDIQNLSSQTLIEKSKDFIEKYGKELSNKEIEKNKKIYIDLIIENSGEEGKKAINDMIYAGKKTLIIYKDLIKDLKAQKYEDKDYIQKLSKALQNAEKDMYFFEKANKQLNTIKPTIAKYKDLFDRKIGSKLSKISKEKLEKISNLLDNLKYKYALQLNSKYNNLLSKIFALDELIKEELLLKSGDELDGLFQVQ